MEEIYLSGNNINSFDDIKLACNALLIKIFWLSNNNLKEFSQLPNYRYLEDLALNNNQINSLKHFGSFLSQLIHLKRLNIENNLIDYYISKIIQFFFNEFNYPVMIAKVWIKSQKNLVFSTILLCQIFLINELIFFKLLTIL